MGRMNVLDHKYENGTIYSGGWWNGLKDGNGEQLWPDGAKYDGEWKENKANG